EAGLGGTDGARKGGGGRSSLSALSPAPPLSHGYGARRLAPHARQLSHSPRSRCPQLAGTARREEAMAYVIAEPCIGTKDASCVDVCPVECIYEAEDQFYIHPEECID